MARNLSDHIKYVVREILKENLTEIFETPPFKTNFNFKEEEGLLYVPDFKDPKGNNIKIYFWEYPNTSYMVDFTLNGNSFGNEDIEYTLKEYTSLIRTIYEAITSFLEKYQPRALDIGGADSFDSIRKEGQKSAIYKYSTKFLKPHPQYRVLFKDNGDLNLIKNNNATRRNNQMP